MSIIWGHAGNLWILAGFVRGMRGYEGDGWRV